MWQSPQRFLLVLVIPRTCNRFNWYYFGSSTAWQLLFSHFKQIIFHSTFHEIFYASSCAKTNWRNIVVSVSPLKTRSLRWKDYFLFYGEWVKLIYACCGLRWSMPIVRAGCCLRQRGLCFTPYLLSILPSHCWEPLMTWWSCRLYCTFCWNVCHHRYFKVLL